MPAFIFANPRLKSARPAWGPRFDSRRPRRLAHLQAVPARSSSRTLNENRAVPLGSLVSTLVVPVASTTSRRLTRICLAVGLTSPKQLLDALFSQLFATFARTLPAAWALELHFNFT